MISHRADPGDFSRETLRQPPLRVACHGPLQRDFTTCDIHVHIPGIQILTGGKVSVNPIVDGEIPRPVIRRCGWRGVGRVAAITAPASRAPECLVA